MPQLKMQPIGFTHQRVPICVEPDAVAVHGPEHAQGMQRLGTGIPKVIYGFVLTTANRAGPHGNEDKEGGLFHVKQAPLCVSLLVVLARSQDLHDPV